MAGGERHVIRMVQLPAWRERLRQAGSVTVTHLLLGTTAVHVSINETQIKIGKENIPQMNKIITQ